jgi:hypothetical protein
MLARAVSSKDWQEAFAFAGAAGLPIPEEFRRGAASEQHDSRPSDTEVLPSEPSDAGDWQGDGDPLGVDAPEVEVLDPEDDPDCEGQRFMGQPVERVEMFSGAFLPVVEFIADLAKKAGVDLTQPRKRVLFKGKPFEREIDADPISRLTDLLAVEACEYFGPEEGEEGITTKGDRRIELLLLGGVTVGPLVLPLIGPLKAIIANGIQGVASVLALLRSREA